MAEDMAEDMGGTLGIVLAGGLARRMGGGDKGLHRVGGRPVLQRVLDRIAPQVDHLAISANGDPSRFAAFGLPVLADGAPDRPGPLAGILAALDHAEEVGADWVLSVPADAPFLPSDLAARLHSASRSAPMAVACSGGRIHPVIALWPRARAAAVRAALASGVRKVGLLTEGAAEVCWPDRPRDPFFNVNTPEDLAAAERYAAFD